MATSSSATDHADRNRIFGRGSELARIYALLDDLPERGAALLVRGGAGIGKSALLEAGAKRAEMAGARVLRTSGVQSEAQLPFAGLHQLVLPVFEHAERLPGPQQTALLGAFGMSEAGAPDRFLLGLAVLELLSDVAEPAPLLIVADDAHWLDRSSAGLLAFLARLLGLGHPTPSFTHSRQFVFKMLRGKSPGRCGWTVPGRP